MTKAKANKIKAMINKDGRYSTYFSSKNETLSVRVYEYTNDKYDADAEKKGIETLMAKLEEIPEYEIIHRTYQGFIHDTDIVFK